MSASHPSVHPVEAGLLPLADGRAVVKSRVRMKVIQGMLGTIDDSSLRFFKFAIMSGGILGVVVVEVGWSEMKRRDSGLGFGKIVFIY
ncbi:hypothetical protein Hanom_Chr01g00030301 [Helianthus anomalus]